MKVEMDAQHLLTAKQTPRWLAVTIIDVCLGVCLVMVWIVLLIVLLSRGQIQRGERVRMYAVFSTQLL